MLNTLQLPEDPADLLGEHAAALDAALRDVAGPLDAHVQASVDAEGRLHASALAGIPDPPSLVELHERTQAIMPRHVGTFLARIRSRPTGCRLALLPGHVGF